MFPSYWGLPSHKQTSTNESHVFFGGLFSALPPRSPWNTHDLGTAYLPVPTICASVIWKRNNSRRFVAFVGRKKSHPSLSVADSWTTNFQHNNSRGFLPEKKRDIKQPLDQHFHHLFKTDTNQHLQLVLQLIAARLLSNLGTIFHPFSWEKKRTHTSQRKKKARLLTRRPKSAPCGPQSGNPMKVHHVSLKDCNSKGFDAYEKLYTPKKN